MLVDFIRKWRLASAIRETPTTLLTPAEFRRELARERIRSTRRSFPFCVLEIQLVGPSSGRAARRSCRIIATMLNRNVRLTDHKAQVAADKFAVLFTDTPEMGGRSAMARIEALLYSRGVSAEMRLEVHDPQGFGNDHSDETAHPSEGDRRRERTMADQQTEAVGRRRDDHRGLAENDSSFGQPESFNGNSAVGLIAPPINRHSPHQARQKTQSGHWQQVGGRVDIGAEAPTCNLSQSGRFLKRSVDIAGASFGLLVGGPVILAAMAAVRWTDGQSAMFKQTREGHRGRPFTIYKLRTMVMDAESQQDELRDQSHRDGPAFKITDDPRVTKVGHFLRKTCLDELPQLWNVLKGDMSLVGPRPLPWHESRACQQWHRRRLDVRPGMTCYWQVDKDRVETFDDWMRMDLRYLERPTLWVDLRLIVRTVAVPLFGRGSH